MATPGELVSRLAEVLAVSEVTLGSYYRNLREAGLVTKGGRGRSAAQMTAKDAAHLLMAVGGSRFEKEAAAKIVADYTTLELAHTYRRTAIPIGEKGHLEGDGIEDSSGQWIMEGLSFPRLQNLPPAHSFSDALAALIDAMVQNEFLRILAAARPSQDGFFSLEVNFLGPQPSVGIQVYLYTDRFSYTEEGGYLLPELVTANPSTYSGIEDDLHRRYGNGDLRISRTITGKTIAAIADLLRGEEVA